MRKRILASTALVAAFLVACLAYNRVFDSWWYLLRFSGAVVVSAMFTAVALQTARPRLAMIVANTVGLFGYVAYALLSNTMSIGVPSPTTVTDFFDGIFNGWRLALDDFLPLADPSPVSVMIVVLIWLSVSAGVWAVARTDAVAPPLLGPILVAGAALPLTAPAGNPRWPVVLAIVVGCVLYLLARSDPSTDLDAIPTDLEASNATGNRLSSVAGQGLPVVLGAAVVGFLLSGPLSFGRTDGYDPRPNRAESIAEAPVVNPLAEYKGIRSQNPPLPAFELGFVRAADFDLVDRIALVVLDDYDGSVWSSSGRFSPVEAALPGDPEIEDRGQPVTQTYNLGAVPGPWLPAAARPVRFEGPAVQFDSESGVLLAEDVNDYVVVSQVVERDAEAELVAPAAVGDRFVRFRALPPGVSPELGELASEIVEGDATPKGRMDALMAYFDEGFAFDPEARSGHSLGRVTELLSTNRVGGAEQYATALAVMARTIGLPARLVVGYDLTGLSLADDGTVDVTSEQYDVWVEVRFGDGFGWVAFDPTPTEIGFDPLENQAPGTTIPEGAAAGTRPTPNKASPSEGGNEQTDEERPLSAWVVPLLIIGFFVLWAMIFGLVIWFTKLRRLGRRRGAELPADRIEGAWAEISDRLLESGVPVEQTMTMSQVIDAGDEVFGDDVVYPLHSLAPDVARGIYAEQTPNADLADAAWEKADTFTDLLNGSQRRRDRIAARLNPKPLLRRR